MVLGTVAGGSFAVFARAPVAVEVLAGPHLLTLFEFGIFWPGAALRTAGAKTTTFLDANLTFKF